MNLAIVTPLKNKYSETFIQAHIDHLKGTKFVYYGGVVPTMLNGHELFPYFDGSTFGRLINRARLFLTNKTLIAYQAKAFYKSLIHQKIDIVLAEYGTTGAAIWNLCRNANIPLIVHFHGFDASKDEVLKKNELEYKRMFDYAAKIIVVSNDMKQQLIKMGAPRTKVFYNIYGVNLDLFPKCQPEDQPPVFLSIGRFVEKKAPHLLIISFKEVVKDYPDAKLLMIGSGPLEAACKTLVEALGIQKNVEFKGIVPHNQLSLYMIRSRAFVQHSIVAPDGDSEGTPNTILEAMASGMPVISTRHAGIKDVILHRENGLLVDEKDMSSMADYMKLIIGDDALTAELGRNARRKVEKNYTLNESIKKLNILINQVLKRI